MGQLNMHAAMRRQRSRYDTSQCLLELASSRRRSWSLQVLLQLAECHSSPRYVSLCNSSMQQQQLVVNHLRTQ